MCILYRVTGSVLTTVMRRNPSKAYRYLNNYIHIGIYIWIFYIVIICLHIVCNTYYINSYRNIIIIIRMFYYYECTAISTRWVLLLLYCYYGIYLSTSLTYIYRGIRYNMKIQRHRPARQNVKYRSSTGRHRRGATFGAARLLIHNIVSCRRAQRRRRSRRRWWRCRRRRRWGQRSTAAVGRVPGAPI